MPPDPASGGRFLLRVDEAEAGGRGLRSTRSWTDAFAGHLSCASACAAALCSHGIVCRRHGTRSQHLGFGLKHLNLVRRILRRYGYPPDKQEKATETVLKQAELLCADWAN